MATCKKTKNWFSKPIFHFIQLKSIAKCSKGSCLQYFRPSLSYQLSLRPLFCLFLSGSFTQALLYLHIKAKYTERERSGSVVECLTEHQAAAGLSLTDVNALWSLSKTHIFKLSTGSTQEDLSLFN